MKQTKKTTTCFPKHLYGYWEEETDGSKFLVAQEALDGIPDGKVAKYALIEVGEVINTVVYSKREKT